MEISQLVVARWGFLLRSTVAAGCHATMAMVQTCGPQCPTMAMVQSSAESFSWLSFFFSFGLLTARISMFYLVMMKEASIIKDNTIRETVDGLLCHPWLEERASKDLVWTLEASGKGCLLADAIANQAKSKSYVWFSDGEDGWGRVGVMKVLFFWK